MSRYDFNTLLSHFDPVFKAEVLNDYRRLLADAAEAAEDEATANQFEAAMQRLAAAAYTIAKELNLDSQEMGVITAYTMGLLSGASCDEDNDKGLNELKVLYSESLDSAFHHRDQSVHMVADMVIDGLNLRSATDPGAPGRQGRPEHRS